MKQQVFVIHGGNAFDRYEDYIESLKSKEVTLEELKVKDWKDNLGNDLRGKFEVLNPRMPNSQNAKFLEWKIWFEKFIPLLDEDIIFVGHSLGGIFLAKYLSENDCPKKIKATLLVAAPYNTPTRHPLADFNITSPLEKFAKQGGKIYLYHSKDDKIVYIDNSKRYQKELPESSLKIFENRGHFRAENFPELVEDIQSLA